VSKNKLRECPNQSCDSRGEPYIESDYNEYMNYRRYRGVCSCGTSGPWCENEKDAIAAYNALPRAPQWTTYTGEPGTLPPPDNGKNNYCVELPNGYRYVGSRDDIAIGETWMPWPGAKGGE